MAENDDKCQKLFQFCAIGDRIGLADYILTSGCNPSNYDVRNRLGKTALHIACQHGRLFTVRALIEVFGCNPKVTDNKGNLPIHDACITGELEVVDYMFTLFKNKNYDLVFLADVEGNNLFHKACQSGSVPLVRYLKDFCMSNLPKLNLCKDSMVTYVRVASYGFDANRVSHSVECALTPNKLGDTPLHIACHQGYLDILKLFHAIMPFSGHLSALMTVATQCNHHSIVTYLAELLNPRDHEVLDFNSEFGQFHDFNLEFGLLLDEEDEFRRFDYDKFELRRHMLQNREEHYRRCQRCGEVHIDSNHLNWISVSDRSAVQLKCKRCDFPCKTSYLLKGSSVCPFCHNGSLQFFSRHRKMIACTDLEWNTIFEQKQISCNSPLCIAVRCRNTKLVDSLLLSMELFPTPTEGLLHSACISDCTVLATKLIDVFKCDINGMDTDGNTPLHIACLWGSTEMASMLVSQKNCYVNRPNMSGITPFHYACRYKRLDICKLLVSNGGSVIAETKNKNTPLNFACYHSDVELTKTVLNHPDIGCVINKADAAGDTPLFNACRSGCIENVQLLIENGANPLYINELTEETPVHIACRMGQLDLLKVLLQNYTGVLDQKSILGATPVHLAIERNSVELLQYLVDHSLFDASSKLNNKGYTLMHIACQKKMYPIVTSLLTKQLQWDIKNDDGNTPLHISCLAKCSKVVKLLTDHCSATCQNCTGRTPIHIACENNDVNSVRCLLLNHSGTLDSYTDSDGNTPLHVACQESLVEIIELLLKFCSITAQNNVKDTPLHIACRIGCTDSVKKLLFSISKPLDSFVNDVGDTVLHVAVSHCSKRPNLLELVSTHCSVTKQNLDGDTPIHLACRKGDYLCTQSLLENCTELVANKKGDSYLHAACEAGSLDIVKLLVEKYNRKELTKENSKGNSPLHIACRANSQDVVEYLVRKTPCSMYTFNKKQQTPLFCALKKGHQELVIDLITKRMFDPNKECKVGQPLLLCVASHSVQEIFEHRSLGIVFFLIERSFTDINQCDKNGNSILHHAVPVHHDSGLYFNSYTLMDFRCIWDTVLSVSDLNIINRPNQDGNTPLHLVCQYFYHSPHQDISYEIVEKLLTYGNNVITPSLSHENNNGKTPIQVAPYNLIRLLILYGASPKDVYAQFAGVLNKYKKNQPLNPVMKIILMGNSKAGKTTLIEAVKADKRNHCDITQVGGSTVGMVTTDHQSEDFGQVKFYDFAGQPEYESNRSAFLEASLCSTSLDQAPIFIITIDASKLVDLERIFKYWFSFIRNHSPPTLEPPPHLITVASHIDLVLPSEHLMIQEAIKDVIDRSQSSTFKIFGPILLDCRKTNSTGMQSLTSRLSESCSSLRSCIEIDCRCHILFTRLIEWFPEKPAVKFGEVQSKIQEEFDSDEDLYAFDLIESQYTQTSLRRSQSQDTLLPYAKDALLFLVESLHSGSHLILLKGQDKNEVEDYWIVMDNDSLYKSVSGFLFSPDDLEIHPSLQTNTGVVSLEMLQPMFDKDIDITLATQFLEYSEFCREIVDEPTLQLIDASMCGETDEFAPSATSSLPANRYYFFPALIKSERQSNVWAIQDQMPFSYSFGWYLQCQNDLFLDDRFLEVLLLRLTFGFAVTLNFSDGSTKHRLFRRCDIWKNGIHWSTRTGVEVLMEVVEQKSAVVLLCRSYKCTEMEAVKVRSEVLRTILDTKKKCCPSTETSEFILHPSALRSSGYPDISKPDSFLPISEVAQAVGSGEPCIIDVNQHPLLLESVLNFDPYLMIGKDIIDSLWSSDYSNKEITNDFLMRLSQLLRDFSNQVAQMLNVSAEEVDRLTYQENWGGNRALLLFHIFGSWKSKEGHATYKTLREVFSSHSVFNGRNPLELRRPRLDPVGTSNMQESSNKCKSDAVHQSCSSSSGIRDAQEKLSKGYKSGPLSPALRVIDDMIVSLKSEEKDTASAYTVTVDVSTKNDSKSGLVQLAASYLSPTDHTLYEVDDPQTTQPMDVTEPSSMVPSRDHETPHEINPLDDQSLRKPASCHLKEITWISDKHPPGECEHTFMLIQSVAQYWRRIAGMLGLQPVVINIIASSDLEGAPERCMGDALTMWLDNASSLPYADQYPLSWTGLYELLLDSRLVKVAEELKCVLSSRYNSVRGNLAQYKQQIEHVTADDTDLHPPSSKRLKADNTQTR